MNAEQVQNEVARSVVAVPEGATDLRVAHLWRDELRRIHRGLATGVTKAPVSTVRYRVAV